MPTTDFSTFPDGAPAGFTQIGSDGQLLVYGGELRVHNGAPPPVDWYWSTIRPDDVAGSVVATMEVEITFYNASGAELWLMMHANVGVTSWHGIKVQSDGNWIGLFEAGGDGPTGTWTAVLNTPIRIKCEMTTSTAFIWTINGVQVASTIHGNARTGLYAGIYVKEETKVHKIGFPTGISGGGGPPFVARANRRSLQAVRRAASW